MVIEKAKDISEEIKHTTGSGRYQVSVFEVPSGAMLNDGFYVRIRDTKRCGNVDPDTGNLISSIGKYFPYREKHLVRDTVIAYQKKADELEKRALEQEKTIEGCVSHVSSSGDVVPASAGSGGVVELGGMLMDPI